jgi:phosphonate transport system substrate-binding protein
MNRRNFIKAGAAMAAAAAGASLRGKTFALNFNQSPSELKMGLFQGADAEQTKKAFDPFRNYLGNKLGIPVTVQTGTSYSAVIEAMRGKFVDAMEVGPFAHVLASSQLAVDPLAVGIYPRVRPGQTATYNAKEFPFYFSVFFTKKGSGITKLSDLRGKRFAFVDPASTSGNLIPRTTLLRNKLDPDKDMQSIFAGSHQSAAVAVWNGKVDAGANFEQNLYDMSTGGSVETCGFFDGINRRRSQAELNTKIAGCKDGQLIIFGFSDPIPNTPFGVREELPPQFKTAIREALLDVRKDPAVVAGYKQWYVDPVKEYPTLKLKGVDQFYDGLRDAARFLKLDLTKLR